MPKTREQLLTEAQDARHAILTGKAVSKFVDQNGEQVEYSKINLGALDGYIRSLQAPDVLRTSWPRPIGFYF